MPKSSNPISTPSDNQTPNDRKEALRLAVRKYGPAIVLYFRYLSGRKDIPEDLAQELWEHVYKYFPVRQFNNWIRLRQKAFQVFVAHYRGERTRQFVEFHRDLPDDALWSATDSMPHYPVEQERFEREFWEKFPGIDITEEQKRVFFLKYHAMFTLSEISKELGVPVSTLHDWLKTVRTKCARHYKP